MDMIFICSKYRGDIKKNVKAAYDYCRLAVGCEYIPIAPHTIFLTTSMTTMKLNVSRVFVWGWS